MRATIHLVTADDCLVLRPLAQPVLDAELARHPDFAAAAGRGPGAGPGRSPDRSWRSAPRTGPELRAGWGPVPGLDAAALAFACRNKLPLVQVPPRGVWAAPPR